MLEYFFFLFFLYIFFGREEIIEKYLFWLLKQIEGGQVHLLKYFWNILVFLGLPFEDNFNLFY